MRAKRNVRGNFFGVWQDVRSGGGSLRNTFGPKNIHATVGEILKCSLPRGFPVGRRAPHAICLRKK